MFSRAFLSLLILVPAALFADPAITYDRVPAPTVTPHVVPVAPVVPGAPQAVRRMYVFGYHSCSPCRSSRPSLDAWLQSSGLPIQRPTANSQCVYIDIENFPLLAEQWGTTSYPTVIVHDDYRKVATHVGAYSVDDLQRLWETGRPAARGGQLTAAFAAAAGSEIQLPRFSLNTTNKAVTILETVDIPYGRFITASLFQGSVLTIGNDGLCTFSQPYPRIRTRPFAWDAHLRGIKVDTTSRTAVLKIDGLPDQTIRF
ncbi:MAG: thioredoxin family protein [Planctomycetota bacterium]